MATTAVLAGGACGSSTTSTTVSPPTTERPTAGCTLDAGPVVIGGVVERISGGFAGIDEASLLPAECPDSPIPVVNLAWDAIPTEQTATDCEDCADSMTVSTSRPVELHGVLVEADDVAGETPGGTAGGLVLVNDGRTHAPEALRTRALDVAGISWDLRTRLFEEGDGLVVCQAGHGEPCATGTRFLVEAAPDLDVQSGDDDTGTRHVRGTTTGDGRIVAEAIGPVPI